SIKGWVKSEVKFSFEIDVTNLSDVELGALLWLLKLEPDCFHRLGGGKPLGFGSVRLEISDTDLRTGNQWQEFYTSLLNAQKLDQTQAMSTVKTFQEALELAYNSRFNQVSFIAAFLKSAQGFSKPIHYPRTTEAPDANVESFKWFVDYESQPKGMKLSLQPLAKDNGLRLQPKKP
ncbi:MAG: TIGR03986 family CRISPR-associated RAMP protein, partial [Pseudanabaena sp.]